MKYRDKLIKYFEDAPEGAVIVANDMYENGFTKMSHDAFFRAVERLCDDGGLERECILKQLIKIRISKNYCLIISLERITITDYS